MHLAGDWQGNTFTTTIIGTVLIHAGKGCLAEEIQK